MQRLIELRLGFVARRLRGTQLRHQFGAVELNNQLAAFHVVAAFDQAFNHPAFRFGSDDHFGGVHFTLQ